MAGIPGPRRLTMGALPRPLQAHRRATGVMATRPSGAAGWRIFESHEGRLIWSSARPWVRRDRRDSIWEPCPRLWWMIGGVMPIAASGLARLFQPQEASGASAITVSKNGAHVGDKALRSHSSREHSQRGGAAALAEMGRGGTSQWEPGV
jgi:hypothetical protein